MAGASIQFTIRVPIVALRKRVLELLESAGIRRASQEPTKDLLMEDICSEEPNKDLLMEDIFDVLYIAPVMDDEYTGLNSVLALRMAQGGNDKVVDPGRVLPTYKTDMALTLYSWDALDLKLRKLADKPFVLVADQIIGEHDFINAYRDARALVGRKPPV
jgi:hypothetical protein